MNKINKQNWLDLAFSGNSSYRLLALEFLPLVADQIQEELLIWYAYNHNERIKTSIFHYLTDEHKNKVVKPSSDTEEVEQVIPERLVFGDKIKDYVLGKLTGPVYLTLIKEYYDLTGSLREAKIAIGSL